MKKIYFTADQLEELLGYQEGETDIYLPNCIFDELKDAIDLKQAKRSCEHLAYAYCYVYLISYLYRYAKYNKVPVKITEALLKIILQTPSNDNYKSYITKHEGILHELKYIMKTKEVPVNYEVSDCPDIEDEDFELALEYIIQYVEFRTEKLLEKNSKINYPFRGFNACLLEDNEDFKYLGYFFIEKENHMIPVDTFIFCMSKEDLGTVGFYLYGFLQLMTDKHPEGWECSKKKFLAMTGLKDSKFKTTLKSLESYNMIYNSHQPYYVNHENEDIEPVPNTYRTKHHSQFTQEKQEIAVREIINFEPKEPKHIEEIEDYEEYQNDDSEELFLS